MDGPWDTRKMKKDTNTPRMIMTARPVPIGGIVLFSFFVPRADRIKPLGCLGLLASLATRNSQNGLV